MRDGYLRGELPLTRTARQVDVLAAFVASGGSRARCGYARWHSAQHRETPCGRPARPLGPYDGAADLPRSSEGAARRSGSRASVHAGWRTPGVAPSFQGRNTHIGLNLANIG